MLYDYSVIGSWGNKCSSVIIWIWWRDTCFHWGKTTEEWEDMNKTFIIHFQKFKEGTKYNENVYVILVTMKWNKSESKHLYGEDKWCLKVHIK